MEEKKLTDEEIVNVADQCFNKSNCIGCKFYSFNGDCKILECQDYVFKTILNQKAEIERLTEEKEDIKLFQLALRNGEIDMTIESPMAKSFYDCIVQIFEQNGAKNFFTTTVELESQKGKYAFTIEKVGGVTVAERIAELQKQVDELKKWLGMKEHYIAILRDKEKQAVKNTAKKYHDAVKKLFDDADCCGWIEDSETKYWHEDNNKIAREQFGVEVE